MNKFFQIVKFGLVGLSNNVISLLIYYVLIYFNTNYLISNILGYILSSIWGYILNKLWVFNASKAKVRSSIVKYYIVYGSSFLINVFLMYLQVDKIGISKSVAPFIVLLITIPYNFILNKFWVYKNN